MLCDSLDGAAAEAEAVRLCEVSVEAQKTYRLAVAAEKTTPRNSLRVAREEKDMLAREVNAYNPLALANTTAVLLLLGLGSLQCKRIQESNSQHDFVETSHC